jgi:hypothetical protein
MRQSRIDNPEKQRKPKRQSRIDNPEKTKEAIKRNWQHIGYTRNRTKTNKTKNTTQKDEQHEHHHKHGVNLGEPRCLRRVTAIVINLIKIRCIILNIFFECGGGGDTLTSNIILFGVMSGNLLPSNHIHILTNRTTALGVYSVSKINLITMTLIDRLKI